MQHAFKVTCEVDDEFLSDIVVTAVEGGISYWCDIIKYETGENPAHTKALIEEEDEEPKTIDIQVIINGINKMLENPPVNKSKSTAIATYYQVFCWLTDALKDPKENNVMIDADVADTVVQFGLFGELRYG